MASNRSTVMSSSSGTKSLYAAEPEVVLTFAVQIKSFTASGTPASAPSVSPRARRASTSLACASASSGVGVQKACITGSRRSIRASAAPVSSQAETSPLRISAAIVVASSSNKESNMSNLARIVPVSECMKRAR